MAVPVPLPADCGHTYDFIIMQKSPAFINKSDYCTHSAKIACIKIVFCTKKTKMGKMWESGKKVGKSPPPKFVFRTN